MPTYSNLDAKDWSTILDVTRKTLQRSTVERLASLISMMKGETFGVVRARKFFTP